MAKTFQFEVWLAGTPEQQAAEAERQALALASHSRAKLSEAERMVGRGKLLEETAQQNIDLAKGRDKAGRILAQAQLADALAMQGRYAEAAQTHPDKHRRKYFRDIGKAIEKPNDEKCKCRDKRISMDNQPVDLTPRFERARIFSPVHGEMVSVVECLRCGHTNARPLRSRLLKANSALSANETLAASSVERKVFASDRIHAAS